MDFGHERVGIGGDHRERPDSGVLPVLPNTSNAKRRAVFHGDRVGLLRLLPLDRLPLEEAIYRDDTAAQPMRIADMSANSQPSHTRGGPPRRASPRTLPRRWRLGPQRSCLRLLSLLTKLLLGAT
jgi:hypothetical protein